MSGRRDFRLLCGNGEMHRIGQPLELFATGRHRTNKLSWFRINLPKELGHSPDKEGLNFL